MHGLYLVWWVQERDLSPVVVGSVLAAGDLALMILELPTGWFADRVGHRTSLILGSIVQVAGMLFCWLAAGVPGLITASVLVAVGDAFRSGADQALLYRTCAALNRREEFQRIEARTRAWQLVALVLLVLLGGAMVAVWGFAVGWIAETTLAAIGVGLAWAMVEPPPADEMTSEVFYDSCKKPPRSFPARRMFALILPAGIVASLASAAAFFFQTSHTITPIESTILVAVITLIEALGSAAASRVPPAGLRAQLVLGISAALLAGVMLMAPGAAAVATIVLTFLMGLAEPLRAAAVQRIARDDVRARAASLASACDKALLAAALPLAGMWRTRRLR